MQQRARIFRHEATRRQPAVVLRRRFADNALHMAQDRHHLTAASAAILSLSVVMCVTAPAASASALAPASNQATATAGEARALSKEQRRAMVALIGRLAEAARELDQNAAATTATVGSTGPSLSTRPSFGRRAQPVDAPRLRRPAVLLARLNLPPPNHL
jgi:hypothetical protein